MQIDQIKFPDLSSDLPDLSIDFYKKKNNLGFFLLHFERILN